MCARFCNEMMSIGPQNRGSLKIVKSLYDVIFRRMRLVFIFSFLVVYFVFNVRYFPGCKTKNPDLRPVGMVPKRLKRRLDQTHIKIITTGRKCACGIGRDGKIAPI